MLTDGKNGRARLADILELNRPEYMRSPNEFSTVKLDKRSLAGAKLSKVSLCGIHFTNCDLQGADLSDGKWLDKAKKSDFRKATAKGLELVEASECDFRGADLSKASLTDTSQCKFDGANLTGADGHGDLTASTFDGAKLDGFDAHLMKITKCSFAKTSFQKGKFDSCVIADSSFAGADLRGKTFKGDDDDDMVFKNCDFSNADLRGAILSHVRFDKCNLTGANFEGAKSSEIKLTGGTDASKAKGFGAKEEKKANAKGPAYLALDAASPTFKNVKIEVKLKVGGKKLDCALYQFDHGGNPSRHQAWLAGAEIGSLKLADAIATVARQNPKATLDASTLVVKASKGTRAPSLKPKAFEAAVLAAWTEALA